MLEQTLLDKLLCPQCASGDWTLDATEIDSLHYADRSRDEVKSGGIVCRNGHSYPISDYVLSLESCFPHELKSEASYWNSYYTWHLTHGSGGEGLHDLKEGYAPFRTSGVEEPFPFADVIDRYDAHYKVAEHPLLRAGRTLLDVGVGLGWTTIQFARAGYEVTAFDPGLPVVQRAKQWAIKQGLFIEYLCAAIGYIQFRPGSFDSVTAFHSLHHVPDLHAGLDDIARWLKP